MSQKLNYDLCVIGGGLTGASIARDAAGRGLSVLLVEARDLAGATSSATSKILHGGVLDLENRGLSRCIKSQKEREVVYKNAQHLFHPMACVMPLDQGDKKHTKFISMLWRAKLWVYNKFGNRSLFSRASFCMINGDDERLSPLKNPKLEEEEDSTTIMKPHERLRFLGNITDKDYALKLAREAMTFKVCRVDDTRLAICNAIDASLRGAKVLNYTSCERLQQREGCWLVSLRDMRGEETLDIKASMVVNATGPWVSDFIQNMGVGKNDPDLPQINLAKDSHIILPRQYDGDYAYALRQDGGSIVYVMPFEDDYTLVGASQEMCEVGVSPRDVRISGEEIRYLLEAYNTAFEKQVTKDSIVFSFSAAHPISINGKGGRGWRDYRIYHHKRCDAPLLTVYGGAMEQYRILAQDVVDRLLAVSGRTKGHWTEGEPLASSNFYRDESDNAIQKPGHNYQTSLSSYVSLQKRDYAWLPGKLLQRYIDAYGTQMDKIVEGAKSLEGLGEHYGDGVYEAELRYLREHEWVFDAEDILWRRSKLALHISEETRENIEAAFAKIDKDAVADEKTLCA